MPWGSTRGNAPPVHDCFAANQASRKFKIPQYQHGQAYLTSHRACYVDHAEPRKNSVAIFLKDVEKTEFYVCAIDLVLRARGN